MTSYVGLSHGPAVAPNKPRETELVHVAGFPTQPGNVVRLTSCWPTLLTEPPSATLPAAAICPPLFSVPTCVRSMLPPAAITPCLPATCWTVVCAAGGVAVKPFTLPVPSGV